MIDKRLGKMRDMAARFAANGSIDKLTMRKIDAIAMTAKIEDMTAAKIQQLREREHISQAVLAMALNMSSESVQKWEQGKTKPHGAALRLLNIINQKGISAII